MSTSVMWVVRGSAQLAVILVSIALGFCAAALAVWAAMYFGHGVGTPQNPHGDSADSIPLMLCVVFFGVSGLIGGVVFGIDMVTQLWADDADTAPMSARIMRVVRRGVQVGVVVLSIVLGLYGAALVSAALGPLWMMPLAPLGLIAGAILGCGAAAQLWPPVDEERIS